MLSHGIDLALQGADATLHRVVDSTEQVVCCLRRIVAKKQALP
jgi:hypothetical protein